MFFGLFSKKEKSCLGIDFGASGIKIAELAREDENRIVLTNYAIGQTRMESDASVSKLSADQIAALLKKLFEKADIRTKRVVFSLSVGETFSTIISLPQMSEKELVKAIPFQARKYVPIPIEEVVLDWSIVGEFTEQKQAAGPNSLVKSQEAPGQEEPKQAEGMPVLEQKTEAPAKKEIPAESPKTIQVLIVAVPQEVIRKIAQIAKKCDLKVLAIEQEAFSIIRSLVGNDESTYLLVDLGQDNVDLVIMDKNSIRLTFTFEKDKSFDLISEAVKIINLYQTRYQRKVAGVILTGGGTTRSNWQEIFQNKLGIPVGIGDPFARLAYDKKLGAALKEIGPFMAVAVGGAMREV